MADSYTAFIDTTLDTHLALIVAASDTVSDLKKKILDEHKLCFPTTGDIKIHALKVKRRGIFYHLSESMFLKSVFDGTNKNWFVNVDASTIEDNDDKQLPLNPDSTNLVAQVGTTKNGLTDEANLLPASHPKSLFNVGDLSRSLDESGQLSKQKADQLGFSVAGTEELNNSCLVAYKGDHHDKVTKLADSGSNPPIQEKYDEPSKENEVQETATGGVEGGSEDGIGDIQGSTPSDGALATGFGAKKKNKRKRKSKDDTDDLAVKEKDALVCQSGENESQQESVAKKRRKIEEENGGDGSVKEKEIVLSDSNKEISKHPTISQHHLVNNQKNAHAALDCLPSETLDRVNLTSDCPSSGKGKKKKKSINPLNLVTAGVPSSNEDVRGESMEVNPNDFSKEPNTAPASVRGITISESCAISVKEKHIDPAQQDKRPSPQDMDMNDTDTTDAKVDGLEEERESLHPESLPHEKCKISDMRSKEAVNTSQPIEASETVNPGTQSKKRKKSKRTGNLLSTTPTSVTKHVKSSAAANAASTESHKAVNVDDSNDKGSGSENVKSSAATGTASTERHKAVNGDDFNAKVNQEESNLPAKEGKEVAEMDTVVTSELVKASETVDPGTASKKRKKSKRMTGSLSRTPASGKEHVNSSAAADAASMEPHKAVNDNSNDKVNQEESNLLAKEGKQVSEMDREVVVTSELVEASEAANPETPLKTRKKSKQRRDLLTGTPTSGTEHVNGSVADISPTKPHDAVNMDDSKDNGNKEESNMAAKKGKVVSEMDAASTFHLATDTEIDNVIENVVKNAVSGYPSKTDHSDKAGCGMEVSCGSDRINFNKYFVPSQDHGETAASGEVIVDKATKAKEISGMNPNKKKKKLDAHSHGPSSDLHGSLRLNGNNGIREKPPAGGVKVPPSSKSHKISSIPAEARKSGALTPVDPDTFATNNKEPSGASNSSLESSRSIRGRGHGSDKDFNQMNGRKVYPAKIGEVVNSSQRKKSLTGKSGTIFQDDNYEHSADDRTDSSDSSTRTPDNSSSSDYSDGESNSDVNSCENGYNSLKSKEGGGKNIKKPFSSGLTLEKILKSSSRYKQAKLTASQSQPEDTESEPVDIVPDSQANP
ncbi:unnamed protein product [Dovyalis caffra]|uniref:Uncharacterized protein n=1 Tax=Dovyalis caffra TaxID=77055 RepID=A0AAV1RB02_9ROSI|nr:unnamed protein product [Dovyalis caffra]